MLLRETMDVCFDIQTVYFDPLRMIFLCVGMVIHEVNTLILRNDYCRQTAENLPELRLRKYERHSVPVLH